MKLIDKSALVAEIEKYISNYKRVLNKVDKSSDDWVDSTLMLESKIDVLQHILFFLNTLEVKEVQEEPVSEDLEEAANNYVGHAPEIDEDLSCFTKRNAFIAGAKWQEEQCQKTIELAEDHAYLAGQEKIIKKACEWIKSHGGFTLGFDGATVRDFLNFINK